MAKYLDIFAECDSNVGTTNLTFHKIDTGDVRPLRQPVRRLPYGEIRDAVKSEIDMLVSANIALASTSPWASSFVMVRKKIGGWRMCVDYRRLNSVTKFDCVPLPRLDEALDAFVCALVFSSLDLAMAYHQVLVKTSDVEKTALITHVGLIEMQKSLFAFVMRVGVSAVDGRSAAGTDWSHLSRVSGQCDRLFKETLGARCGSSRRIQQNLLC